MKKITTILLAASLTFAACDIERIPSGSMLKEDITSNPEDLLSSTLNGCYAQLKGWSDVMHRCGEYAGDNVMIRGTSSDAFYEFISYSRTPNNYRLQTFWDNSYKVIAQSSNIMKMIPEGKSGDLDTQLGECYFLRGMMYFYLCRAYGRPYYQSPETNLGVPIVNGTPDDLFHLSLPDRSTVKDTYRQAISDLRKAEKMITADRGPAYASVAATQALLSRVYLYMSGTYASPNAMYADSAAYYATQVIASEKFTLLPREKYMQYNTLTPENNDESIFVVKRIAYEFKGDDHYYGIGGMYSNIGGMGWGEMYASAQHLSLLDETGRNDWTKNKLVDARAAFIEPQYVDNTDLGYKQQVFRFIKEVDNKSFDYMQDTIKYDKATGKIIKEANGSYICWEGNVKDNNRKEYTITPENEAQGIYTIVYEGKTYTGVIDNMMKLNRVYPMFYIVKCSREGEESQLHSPIISRLAEMYLNRSEAYAKLGRYTESLSDLNLIRERSLPGKGYTATDFTPTDAPKLIDKERQLELAFQAERSYDVYRNGDPLTRKYPGPHNAMEDVQPTDYRVVYYIPQNAINSYPGTLTQNPTQ